jgi:hypothetical protein
MASTMMPGRPVVLAVRADEVCISKTEWSEGLEALRASSPARNVPSFTSSNPTGKVPSDPEASTIDTSPS